MDEPEDVSWEDRISKGFVQMTIQDDETGECWPVKTDELQTEGCSAVKTSKSCCSAIASSKKWKIPTEYSLLGCSSKEGKPDIQPLLADEAECLGEAGSWSCEKEEEAGETVLVAKFPPVGKVPLFSRKRMRPVPSTPDKDVALKSSTADTTRKKRFLEGRDGVAFVGRLILAILILLSPGYFLPLFFTIRVYCHYWKHLDGDQSDEEIVDPSLQVFGFLRTRAFLKYSCRYCREQLQSEKMFRIHTKYGSASSPKLSNSVPVIEEDSFGCDCPNH